MRYYVSDLSHESGSQGLLLVCENEGVELVLEERVVTCESARDDYPKNQTVIDYLWLLHYYFMKVQADDHPRREGMPDVQGDQASE